MFRAYDIRGVYPDQLNEETIRDIGRAIGTLKNGKVMVGRDTRSHGESLKKAFIEGVISTGCDVTDVGVATTSLMIFCSGFYDCIAVNITASHNPLKYNGLKVFDKGAIPLGYESGLKEIEDVFNSKKFKEGKGSVSNMNPREDYASHLLGNLKTVRVPKKKIVIDCFNGATSRTGAFLLEKMGMEVLKIRCDEDGEMPEDGPDPANSENLKIIRQKIIESGADIGFAYDGDGDRLAVFNNKGEEVSTMEVGVLLAKQALANKPGAKIVFNTACSMVVFDAVKELGGIPIECKVGHTFVTQKMIEEDAVFAGELSGHFFFKELFYGDDALLASMKLLLYLAGKDLDKERENIPSYFTFLKDTSTIKVTDESKFGIIENIKKDFVARGFKVVDLDGVKAFVDDGWILFRSSHTTPIIKYGYESRTKEGFEKVKKIAEEVISNINKYK